MRSRTLVNLAVLALGIWTALTAPAYPRRRSPILMEQIDSTKLADVLGQGCPGYRMVDLARRYSRPYLRIFPMMISFRAPVTGRFAKREDSVKCDECAGGLNGFLTDE